MATLSQVNPKIQAILAGLQSRFQELYGDRLVQMVLYGSQARGDAEEGSDIDVLVVLKGPVRPGQEISRTSDISGELSLQHNEVISCLFMDEERFANSYGPLLRNIRKEGVKLGSISTLPPRLLFVTSPSLAVPDSLTANNQHCLTSDIQIEMLPKAITPAQQKLLLKARESLAAARVLIDTDYPGYAASRAYYAMFYIAEAFLEGERMSFSKHSAVISAFGREFARKGRVPVEFHRFLREAQEVRNTGYYGEIDAVTDDEATEQIARAEQFLELAENLIGTLLD